MENWLILRLIFAGLVFATKFPGVTVGSLRGFLTWMLLEFVHVFFLDSPLLLLKSSQPKRRPRGENLPSCPHKEGWRQVEGLGFLQNDYFRFISFKGRHLANSEPVELSRVTDRMLAVQRYWCPFFLVAFLIRQKHLFKLLEYTYSN